MRSYSKVERFLWRDPRFSELSEDAQKLWLYLLTSPCSMPCPGLFVASQMVVLDDIGWLREGDADDQGKAYVKASARLTEAFRQLKKKGWVEFDSRSRVVLIPSAPRHNMPESNNVVISWATALQSIPSCSARERWISIARETLENAGKLHLREAFDNALSKTSLRLSEGKDKASVVLSEGKDKASESLPLGVGLGLAYQEQEQEQEHNPELEEFGASKSTFKLESEHQVETTTPDVQAEQKKATYHEHAEPLAQYMLDRLLAEKPDMRTPTPAAFNGWVRDMHRMLALDGRDAMRVKTIIEWVTKDEFWSPNVRSPGKLREQFDKLELHMGRRVTRKPAREEDNPHRELPYYEDIEEKMRRAGIPMGGDQ